MNPGKKKHLSDLEKTDLPFNNRFPLSEMKSSYIFV